MKAGCPLPITQGVNSAPNILFIDDNPGDVQLLEVAFADAGVASRLHTVSNAVKAFEFLSRRRSYLGMPSIDLILLDLNLPVFDGKMILRELKKDPEWSRIPVVIFSSSESENDRSDCEKLGATAYLVKPHHFDQFVEIVPRIVRYARGGMQPS